MIEIKTKYHSRTVNLPKWPAMTGLIMRDEFVSFAKSKDASVRRAYVMKVMEMCTVNVPGAPDPMAMKTPAMVSNQIGGENIKAVFEATLRKNGIEPESAADHESPLRDPEEALFTSFFANYLKLQVESYSTTDNNQLNRKKYYER